MYGGFMEHDRLVADEMQAAADVVSAAFVDGSLNQEVADGFSKAFQRQFEQPVKAAQPPAEA
jgi:hypothetical protein